MPLDGIVMTLMNPHFGTRLFRCHPAGPTSKLIGLTVLSLALGVLRAQENDPRRDSPPPSLVGEHGRQERLLFEGQRHFSREQLVGGLRFNVDFLLAAEPDQSMSRFLTRLERLLERGYRGNGFAEAKVAASWDEPRQAVVVRIDEGTRQVAGDVEVMGGRTIANDTLRTLLLSTNKLSFRQRDDGEVEDQQEKVGPVWTPGNGVDFTRFGELQHSNTVKEVLFLAGYPYARFRRELAPQPDGTCVMRVTIEEEGPQARIGSVLITGAKRNTPDAIVEQLGIAPGQRYDARAVSLVGERLIEGGRFIDYTLDTSPIDERGEVHLTIGVRELEEAPPLGEDLSEVQQLLLKCQRWLVSPEREQFDLELTLRETSSPPVAANAVLSPAGMIIEVEAPDKFLRTVLILTRTNWTLAVPSLVGRVTVATTNRISAFMETTAGDDWASEGRFSLSLGAALATETDGAVVAFAVRVLPASMLAFSQTAKPESSATGPVARISSAGRLFEIERASGRLIRATFDVAESGRLEVTTQRGRFHALHELWTKELAALPNHVSTQRPTSTALAGLLRLALSQPGIHELLTDLESRSAVERMVAGLQVLDWEKVLLPFEGVRSALTDGFLIPPDVETGGALATGLAETYGGLLAGAGTELFPTGSFPWQALRLVGFSMAQRDSLDFDQFLLERRGESPAEGPAGIWVAAKLLRLFDFEPASRPVARAGYRLMSPAKFRSELATLLEDQSVFSRCFQELGRTLANDSDADVQQLATAFGPPWSEFIHGTVGALRQNPDKPLVEVWLPVWERLWRNGLEEAMEEDFFRMASPSERR